MKDYFSETFMPYQGKIIGLLLSILAIGSMLMFAFVPDLIELETTSIPQKLEWSGWLLAFSLILMAYSKERIEDERVLQIRNVALRLTIFSATLACCVLGVQNIFQADTVLFVPVVVVSSLHTIYLLFFHLGLWTDHPDFYLMGEQDPGDDPNSNSGYLLGMLIVAIGTGIMYYLSSFIA
ncbi:MAG: hypothetical protein AAFP89_03320 [Bacteroidota bacterium]